MAPEVLLIGTLDTKEEKFSFVRNLILDKGLEVLVMNTAVLSAGPYPTGDG